MLKKLLMGWVLAVSCTFLQAGSAQGEVYQIVIDEGLVSHVYVGPLGNLHAGVGHLLPNNGEWTVGQEVSRQQISEWFWEDYFEAVRVADRFAPNAPHEVRMILINMAFNLGESRLNTFVKLKLELSLENWYGAAYQMLESDWYDHVGARAERLNDRMRSYGSSQLGKTKRGN